MGNLTGREIVQSRIWMDPQNSTPVAMDWDYKFTYPVTVFDAVMSNMGEQAVSLTTYHRTVQDQLDQKQSMIPSGPDNRVMMWTNTEGNIGYREIRTSMGVVRSNQILLTEKAIADYADTKADKIAYDNHVLDAIGLKPHITETERQYWNLMAPLSTLNTHVTDTVPHITTMERTQWNAKANQTDLIAHTTDTNNPHLVTAAQTNSYTRQQIREMIKAVEPKFWNYKNIYWDYLTDANAFSLELFNPGNWNPTYVFGYKHNQDYFDNPDVTVGNSHIHVDDPILLPDVPPGQRYFALVAKYPPEVDSTTGSIRIYFKDVSIPWRMVKDEEINNGDLFVTYPDRRIYLWSGNSFREISTTAVVE